MNTSFRAAVNEVRRTATETLTHKQRVTRLYRNALRTLDSWAADRELFHTEGQLIRDQFTAAKGLDPASG